MISKRIEGRKDGHSSALDALRYGEGLTPNGETETLDKSHRTRLMNFGLMDDGIYVGRAPTEMAALIELASIEMQSNCDLNTRVAQGSQIAHFVCSFNQVKPTEAVLRDTEDSILAALELSGNHSASFLHNDNGFWHLHIFSSRIEKEPRHRCNALWHDQIKRDKVCREIEQRHGLLVDNGFHRIDEQGHIVEVPRAERRARREQKPFGISDDARAKESYSGEKSFQTWCNEIRIGDRLKHAKSWKYLHEAAAAYGCEVKPKGAGFVICPAGEKGGIQLSKVGLKNLPAKFGVFVPSEGVSKDVAVTQYTPAPTKPQAANLYTQWCKARDAFKEERSAAINEQREAQKQARADLREQHKGQLAQMRATPSGPERIAAVSIAKMEQAAKLSRLADQFADERRALRLRLAENGPGKTFRDYLIRQAERGDGTALAQAQRYGADESSPVTLEREASQLRLTAGLSGNGSSSAPFPAVQYRVMRTGTVVFDLGGGRTVTDSHAARMVQLNNLAAGDPRAVEVALRFAVSKFGTPLTLTGSPEFQRLAVEIAVRKGLGVRFSDPALELYRQEFAAAQRQQFAPFSSSDNKPAPQALPTKPQRLPVEARAMPVASVPIAAQTPPSAAKVQTQRLPQTAPPSTTTSSMDTPQPTAPVASATPPSIPPVGIPCAGKGLHVGRILKIESGFAIQKTGINKHVFYDLMHFREGSEERRHFEESLSRGVSLSVTVGEGGIIVQPKISRGRGGR